MVEYKINPDNENVSIQVLMERIEKGYKLQDIQGELEEEQILQFNDSIILAPDYQREYRFTLDDEVALVESALLGIPIPPIFLATDKYKKVKVTNVVDGQHRLRALYRFINNKFKLSNIKLLTELEGKGYRDLDIDLKAELGSVRILTTIFKDFPGIKFELEIFNRYNKGTKPLSPQEIRHAVYNSQLNSYINDFTYSLFRNREPVSLYKAYNVTKDRIQKKKVQEGIFVLLSILEYGINRNFDKSLVYAENYMKEKSELEKNNQDEASENFSKIRRIFSQFNDLIIKMQNKLEHPFSKEIYGISSRNYKFQISIGMILAGIFHKLTEGQKNNLLSEDESKMDQFLKVINNELRNSFLEDPNYRASSTNSKEIQNLIDNISFEDFLEK